MNQIEIPVSGMHCASCVNNVEQHLRRLKGVQSAAVKRLVAKGKERGYITFDELNAVLPQDQMSSEQIEDTMAMLSEAGLVEGPRLRVIERPGRRLPPR